jgi:acyl carrier protein
MDIITVIKKFIETEIMFGDVGVEITDNTPLIEQNILDSLAIMKLLLFIEEKYSIHIGDEELIPEHFESPKAIASLLETKINNLMVK